MSENTICNVNLLPLGLQGFSNIRAGKMAYVDKTELIAKIANQRTPIFLSRPRRFGKSLLINTLKSLFTKGLDDFRGLSIEKMWNDSVYGVVHLDFSSIADSNAADFKRDLVELVAQQFKSTTVQKYDSFGVRSPSIVLSEIVQDLDDNSIVLLIDEYDAPLTHHIHQPDDLKNIISILSNFYATIKQFTDKFRLIFITGVARISHVSIFSAFNNLVDISLDSEFNSLLGFTKNDLEKYFDIYVANSANILGMTKDDVYKRLEQYYDGFQFSLEAEETVYNPWSVLSFFKFSKKAFTNYWFKSSGSSSIIMQYLRTSRSFKALEYQDIDICIDKDKLSNQYDISDIPNDILLLQIGYLTLRKKTKKLAKLVFPNTEVEDSILKLFLSARDLEPDVEDYCEIDGFIACIDRKDLHSIIDIFNCILNDCVSYDGNIFNDERSVRDVIYAAIPQAEDLQKIKEHIYVKGRSDLELITRKIRMVIEFKRTRPNRNAKESLDEAICQIQSKNYGIGPFQKKELYRVAMVISTEKKAILEDFSREFF
ncbi:MAG: AAA family ATPase [Desulfovibrionaceae bacterium]|nr:AAA family ATPase [Desulfovibrionaceae bacterium]